MFIVLPSNYSLMIRAGKLIPTQTQPLTLSHMQPGERHEGGGGGDAGDPDKHRGQSPRHQEEHRGHPHHQRVPRPQGGGSWWPDQRHIRPVGGEAGAKAHLCPKPAPLQSGVKTRETRWVNWEHEEVYSHFGCNACWTDKPVLIPCPNQVSKTL